MLVLSRLVNESIMIGDTIRLVVIDIRGNKVKLGFEADKGIQIHRQELWLRIKEEIERESGGKDNA